MSGEISADGGGATTEGDGNVNLADREVARSGAETGGGTTDSCIICTGAVVISRVTPPGAGGITFEANAGLVRPRSRATLGAGATIAGVNAGATSLCSPGTLGAGGIISALKEGAVSVRSRVTLGAGAITDSS